MESDARSLSPDAQEALRRRAVAAVEGGMRQVEAARVFGVTRQAVGKWIKAQRSGGAAALAAKPQGRPEGGGRLSKVQSRAIARLIVDRNPDQLKLPFVLWTRQAVQTLIARRYRVRISLATVGRYPRHWGMTPQKPVRRAYERNEEAVARWLTQEYPAIVKRAKARKARIYWGDEMGLRSDHQAGRSYAPKGKTPVVPGTGQRFRCNLISAITNRGHLSFMVFKSGFTTKVFLRFLRRLVRQSKQVVYLIVDGHPVHHSRAAKAWLEKNRARIRLFYLPGYSPDLNPDEMLNQDVKTNAVGKKRPRDQKKLMANVRRYVSRRRSQPELVQRYFHEASVRYAIA